MAGGASRSMQADVHSADRRAPALEAARANCVHAQAPRDEHAGSKARLTSLEATARTVRDRTCNLWVAHRVRGSLPMVPRADLPIYVCRSPTRGRASNTISST